MGLLRQRYETYGDWVGRWDDERASKAEALVLKVHARTQIGAFMPDIIATCHRDLRDVALSLRDYKNLHTDAEILREVDWARGCHDQFEAAAAIDLPYEQMIAAPSNALVTLAGVLKLADPYLDPDLERVRADVEGWQPLPGDAQHRFDGRPGRWRDQLSEALRAAIEGAHGDWLRRFGYL